MKSVIRLVLIALAMAGVVQSTACIRVVKSGSVIELHGKTLKGNGVITTKSVEIPEYSSVEAYRGVEIILVDSLVGQLSVRADENVMPYVVVTCENGNLVATIDDVIKSVGDVTVELTLPINSNIKRIKAGSAADIKISNLELQHELKIESTSSSEIEGRVVATRILFDLSSASDVSGSYSAEVIEVDCSSSAEFSSEIYADVAKFELSSAASADVSGECRELSVDASSSAEFDGKSLICEQCKASASSAADIEVACLRRLDARASSAGSVHYIDLGGCDVHAHKSSGGSVKEIKR